LTNDQVVVFIRLSIAVGKVLETVASLLNWNPSFTQISKPCKENKLREFNYTTYAGAHELLTYAIETDSKCLYCNESDSILHSFVSVKHLSRSLVK